MKNTSIDLSDLTLINNLSSRKYTGNQFSSNASSEERDQLKTITTKLKGIAKYYADKYKDSYGPFESSISTGNPISIGGTNFKRVWSGIFKGNENKQYSAQISFVMNPIKPCLDVGFYFGRASGHSLNKEKRMEFENQLNKLGKSLANEIQNNSNFNSNYNTLFDYGFKASNSSIEKTPDSWLYEISTTTKGNQIVVEIKPNSFGVIDLSIIDFYVSKIIFLMGAFDNSEYKKRIKPLSPEQRAKEAEVLTLIGLKGEEFIFEHEIKRLKKMNLYTSDYPRHIANESMTEGYDILSLDNNGNEIYIEVKSTTRSKRDNNSKLFFLSNKEYNLYIQNKNKFKLYRVYDIYNNPEFEIIDLEKIEKLSNGYIIKY